MMNNTNDAMPTLAEYAADVAEARRLVALNESIHNGEIRQERGEAWYGSAEFREWDRTVWDGMSICLPRVMDCVEELEAENARLRAAETVQAAALEAVEALVDADFPPWIADYARAANSEMSIQQYETGWSNGVHVVQQNILIALGIKPSAEDHIACQQPPASPVADDDANEGA